MAPRGDELVDAFYARLFDAAPSVRPLAYGAKPEHYPSSARS